LRSINFQIFVQDIGRKVHNLNADVLKDALFNTAPNSTDTVYNSSAGPPAQLQSASNAAEIAAGNGYSAGGTTSAGTAYSQTAGTATLSGGNVVFTASGGTIPTGAGTFFRYVVMYNSSAGAAATRPVIGWWDYSTSIQLQNGETFTVDHSANILTIA
jgi:hypothetical protein